MNPHLHISLSPAPIEISTNTAPLRSTSDLQRSIPPRIAHHHLPLAKDLFVLTSRPPHERPPERIIHIEKPKPENRNIRRDAKESAPSLTRREKGEEANGGTRGWETAFSTSKAHMYIHISICPDSELKKIIKNELRIGMSIRPRIELALHPDNTTWYFHPLSSSRSSL